MSLSRWARGFAMPERIWTLCSRRWRAATSAASVERATQRGHLSVTEHASFTFAVEGVSRALLAQLTRHRLASFSVQSQRYVSMADGFD